MPLAGQRVVVAGGSSGIGLASAQCLAAAGAELVLVARSAERLARAAQSIDHEVMVRSCDLADAVAAKALFDDLGAFDHLVIAAGGSPAWGAFLDLDPERLNEAFRAKFWVQFHAARYGVPHLRADGSITFLGGGASRAALPGTAGLAAVNGAITAMARTMARELAPIRVNVLSPGFVDTPAYLAMPADARAALYQRMARAALTGRVGRAEELAQAVLFLVTNNFTTGAVLDVDGGRRLVSVDDHT